MSTMRTTIDAGRLLVLRAARLYDEVLATKGPEEASEACNEESSIAKLFCGEQCFYVCDTAMQVFGGSATSRARPSRPCSGIPGCSASGAARTRSSATSSSATSTNDSRPPAATPTTAHPAPPG